MVELADLAKLTPNQSAQLDQDELFQLQDSGLKELARRSVAGAVVMPLCTVLGLLAADFSRSITEPALWAFGVMLALGFLRGWTLWTIIQRRIVTVWGLRLFVSSCLGMAACWGIVSAFYITPSTCSDGHVFHFVMVLTAGICAAAVSNFCIWKRLAAGFVLLALCPGVGVVFLYGGEGAKYVAAVMVLFVCYLLVQLEHWHRQYWLGLTTSAIAEKQSRQLSAVNVELHHLVTKEQESRQEIENSRAKLRHLFDYALDGFLICSEFGQILEANGTCEKIIGRKRGELLTMYLAQILSERDPHSSLASALAVAFQGNEVELQALCAQEEGRQLTLQLHIRKVLWQGESVLFFTIRDISFQAETEGALDVARRALQESEGYLRAILKNVELPIYCKDLEGKYVTVNGQFEKLCSLSAAFVRGKEDRELFPDETAIFFGSRDDEIIRDGQQVVIEGIVPLSGRPQNILIHKFALKHRDGSIYGSAGICTDKTLMKNALQVAQVAQEAKTEFLARMSHELRTPLHAVLSFARLGMKRSEAAAQEKLLFYFKMIENSGDQLLELLNSLFEAATHEKFRGGYRFCIEDLRKDIDIVVQQFIPLMAEKEVMLTTDIPVCPVVLRYDRVKLLQVLRNLLANALKYSGSGLEVQLVVVEDSIHGTLGDVPAWKVSLVDQGVGVEESDCERIFEKFVQGSSPCAEAGGVGLGLAICKDIVEDHGGIIWASKNHGAGATFSFLLPQCEGEDGFSR